MMRRLLVLLSLLHGVGASDVILRPPRNTALVANDALRMTCRTNSSHSRLRWLHTPTGSNTPSQMNDRETATLERYREFGLIPGHNGSYDLYTGSVRLTHSGIYTCKVTVNHRDDVADLLEASAHLIVLQSSPVCETSPNMKNAYVTEGDVIRMSCKVQFTGNWIPSMKWIQAPRDPTKEVLIDYIRNASITSFYQNAVTSTLELEVNSSMNGLSLGCKTFFDGSPYFTVPDSEVNDNAPDYNVEWTPGPLNISFGPRNLVFLPKREVYNVGEQVICYADGNPELAYEWKELETNAKSYGAVLTVERTKSSRKAIYQFRCTATNYLSFTEDVLIFTIEESVDFLPPWMMSGLLVIGGVLFIVIAIVAGGMICRRQKKRSNRPIADKFPRRLEDEATDDKATEATADSQTRMADQSPDLLSTTSSMSSVNGSSHTYADIEDQIQRGNYYNELVVVDHREPTTVLSSAYRGLSLRVEDDGELSTIA